MNKLIKTFKINGDAYSFDLSAIGATVGDTEIGEYINQRGGAVKLTKSEYDAIEVKNPTIIYIVEEEDAPEEGGNPEEGGETEIPEVYAVINNDGGELWISGDNTESNDELVELLTKVKNGEVDKMDLLPAWYVYNGERVDAVDISFNAEKDDNWDIEGGDMFLYGEYNEEGVFRTRKYACFSYGAFFPMFNEIWTSQEDTECPSCGMMRVGGTCPNGCTN